MPGFLESYDSSSSSSSIDDESIEFHQMQTLVNSNSSLQNICKPVEKQARLSTRNSEKLPKEVKEEVDKFLKGFSPAPFDWISDPEESLSSEDSLFDEEKVSSMPSTDGYRTDAQECMKESDMKLKHDHMISGKIFSSKNEDLNMKKFLCYLNVLCNDKRRDSDSKESYVPENTDWKTQLSSLKNDANGYDDDLTIDADNIPESGLHKEEMMLVQKVGGVLAGVHDQDQETLSFVPTADGLVLELCRASTLQKGNYKNKTFDELLIQKIDDFDQGSPAKSQTFPTLQSRFGFESEPATEEPLLEKGISLESHMQSEIFSASLKSPKVDEGRQIQMCSMDFSEGSLEALRASGNEGGSADLAPISPSALLSFSESVSLRSDSSNNSTRSFAFPVLASEWNSSPAKMAPADRRYLRRKRRWRFCCFGCTKSTLY